MALAGQKNTTKCCWTCETEGCVFYTLYFFASGTNPPYPKKTFEVDFRYYRMIVCIRSVCVFFETIYKGFCTRIFWARCTFPGDVSLVCLKMMAALLSLEALTDLKSWIAFGGVWVLGDFRGSWDQKFSKIVQDIGICRGEMPMEQDGNMQITIFFLWNFFNLYGILLITVYAHEGRDSWMTRKKTTTGLPTWARVQICEDQFCMDGWTWFRTCTEHCKTLGPSESALVHCLQIVGLFQ